jgi:hypothetical protein
LRLRACNHVEGPSVTTVLGCPAVENCSRRHANTAERVSVNISYFSPKGVQLLQRDTSAGHGESQFVQTSHMVNTETYKVACEPCERLSLPKRHERLSEHRESQEQKVIGARLRALPKPRDQTRDLCQSQDLSSSAQQLDY